MENIQTSYRVSKYNLYLPMHKKGQYLIVQGVRGSFDVVTEDIVESLKEHMHNGGFYATEHFGLSEEIIKSLFKRGYITDQTEESEFEFVRKLSTAINERGKKNISITLLPTYNCNFRCEYCFERNLQNKGTKWLNAKMSPDIVDAVFSQLEKFKSDGRRVEGLYLFGGEPLLRINKDIVRYICDKAKKMNLPISCISNGYDLNEYIDLIKEFSFRYVQITIDGIGEEHDKRRFLTGGQGSFDRIMKNVDMAVRNGINVVLRTNVNKKNIPEMKKLMDLYRENGWTSFENFKFYFKSTLQCYDALKDAYSDVELVAHLQKEFGIENADIFQFNSIYSALSDKLKFMLENGTFAPLRSGYCGANMGMYTIDPFGDIYPCWDVLTEESEMIGHVDKNTGTFEFNSNHDRWKCRTVDIIADCKDCPYMLFCGGGCAAQAKVMHNDINKVFCDNFQPLFNQVAVEVCEQYLANSKA